MMPYVNASKDAEIELWTLKCQHCGQTVGTIDHKEMVAFLYWLSLRAEIVTCFDCDDVGADKVPEALMAEMGKNVWLRADGETGLQPVYLLV